MKKSFQKIMFAAFLIVAHTLAICGMEEDRTTIKGAVINGYNDALNDMFNKGGIDKNNCDVHSTYEGGYTALHFAAQYDSAGAVDILFCHNANIDAVDSNGNTPLHVGILHDSGQTAQFLIERGADCTLKNKAGQTARDLAKQKGDEDTLWYMNRYTTN